MTWPIIIVIAAVFALVHAIVWVDDRRDLSVRVRRVHVYGRRDKDGELRGAAEYLYRLEAEADEIERDLQASGWTTWRKPADPGWKETRR